jgi:predicted aspartyl protease
MSAAMAMRLLCRTMLALSLLATGCAVNDALARTHPVALTRSAGLPYVATNISGHPARLLVDTGAPFHVLSHRLARQLDLYTLPTEHTWFDAGGGAQYGRLSQSVHIDANGWHFVDDGVTVLQVHDQKVDGFLSPQWIPKHDGAVVLDLLANQLRWMQADEVAREYSGWISTPLTICADEMYSQHVLVRATVSGQAVLLVADTGAGFTAVAERSSLGRVLATKLPAVPKRLAFQSGYGQYELTVVPAQVINVGTYSVTHAIGLVPREWSHVCGDDGAVGMDVLSGCAMVFAERSATLYCRP